MNKSTNIHIIGVSGVEGSSIAHYLVKEGYTNITCHDFCEKKEFAKNFYKYHQEFSGDEKAKLLVKTKTLPVKFCYKEEYLDGILEAEIIYVPQSWYLYKENAKIKEAQKKGIMLSSMMQLYLEKAPCKTIGITGTNGKTTTSTLIYHILHEAGYETYLVGNDRKNVQILENISAINKKAFLVLEISNRHLKMPMIKSPHIALITNISQNHLSEHKDFDDYIATKLSITSKQTKADYLILNNGCKVSSNIDLGILKSNIVRFDKSSDVNLKNVDFQQVKLKGEHNEDNIGMALKVMEILNIDQKKVLRGIYSFSPVAKRLEEIVCKNGITFVNDVSSTTPDSTIKALKTFKKGKIILVIGGSDKGFSYDELASQITEKCKSVYYFEGTVAEKLIPKLDVKMTRKSEEIADVISRAFGEAKEGDTILFSPVGEGFISNILKNRSLNTLVLEFL